MSSDRAWDRLRLTTFVVAALAAPRDPSFIFFEPDIPSALREELWNSNALSARL